MSYMDDGRLRQILDGIAGVRVAVVGDFCLDLYWCADMTRSVLSRETPLFPRPIVRETATPGAAANVAWNLRALGVKTIVAVTAMGDDWRGDVLKRKLSELGVDLARVVTEDGRMTPAYSKVVLEGLGCEQHDSRIDFENACAASNGTNRKVADGLAKAFPDVDAVIVADQLDGGVVTEQVRRALESLTQQHQDKVVIVDSRERIGSFSGAILKPNGLELMKVFGEDVSSDTPDEEILKERALELANRTGRPVYVTVGKRGVLLAEDGKCVPIPGVPAPPPVDIVGAGDTFIAALAASLGGKASSIEAGQVANLAASVTVRKLNQTGTATPDEIINLNKKGEGDDRDG